MDKKIAALVGNGTWDLVDLPRGKKLIGCKWVFKVKLKANDYEEAFSLAVKMNTIRCLIALAACKGWDLFQLDVNNAFLHGDLKEEVYMKVPEGFDNPGNKVCKLRKSIYGLKQASRQWFEKLVSSLIDMGFEQSKNDYSLFIKRRNGFICVAAVYVDDIILTGNDTDDMTCLRSDLHNKFTIKYLGRLSYFLGIEVGYTSDGNLLSQKKFTKELTLNCGLPLKSRAVTPFPLGLKLQLGDPLPDAEQYRSLVGKLNFLTHTRHDLSFAVQSLSQFMQQTYSSHLQAPIHTLSYVANTEGQGILLRASDHISLHAFFDLDWASCVDSMRLVTEYVLLGKSIVAWKSKKQGLVSKSSAEVKYRAMAILASEVTWTVRLL
ncbi:uncharacterized protein LOC110698858 [Chenopodium quinoa]|uniref:uncharacterized protein LOC110698858 n=1 Tax=Chenopodium quinoa TaxID=63459 RepID=UPI000B77D797|nr:uncharacterized protein LOC110698858 [Chenopodium quinoa]